MSIKINDNRKSNFALREGVLLKSIDGGDYGILIETDKLEEKYNVLLLNTSSHYPETVYAKGILLSDIKEEFIPISNAGDYDIELTIDS